MEILREVILNAIVHKYYPSCIPIQIKVFDDHISIMNTGFWPFEDLPLENVYSGEHSSYPLNPLIGNGFYFAGEMDAWGQGFVLIKKECERIHAPLPEIKATEKHVTATIFGCEKYMDLLGRKNLDTFSTTGGGESGGDDKAQLIISFCSEAHSRKEIQKYLGIKSETYVREKLILQLIKDGRIRRVEKNKNSRNQKYIATKTEDERLQAILDNNPVLSKSPETLIQERIPIEQYLDAFTKNEQAIYKEYYKNYL